MPRFQAGAALPVVVTTGGRVAAEAATPVYVVTGGPVIGRRARRVQVVTSGAVKDQAAIPVLDIGTGASALYTDEPPLLVYIVAGSLGATQQTTYTQKVQATAPGNLIGYWPQAEASGTTATDESGNGRNGTYTNVTLGQTGIGDGRTAASFNGTTSFNNIYSASLAGAFNGQEGTAAGWIQVSAAGVWTDSTTRYMFSLLADANNTISLRRSTTNNTFSYIYKAGGTTKSIDLGSLSSTGWMHVALTWSKSGDAAKAYMSGAQVQATLTGLGTFAGALASTSTRIGALNSTPNNVWSGLLAHLALWNTPLSAAQIAALAVVP